MLWTFQFGINDVIERNGGKFVARSSLRFELNEACHDKERERYRVFFRNILRIVTSKVVCSLVKTRQTTEAETGISKVAALLKIMRLVQAK